MSTSQQIGDFFGRKLRSFELRCQDADTRIDSLPSPSTDEYVSYSVTYADDRIEMLGYSFPVWWTVNYTYTNGTTTTTDCRYMCMLRMVDFFIVDYLGITNDTWYVTVKTRTEWSDIMLAAAAAGFPRSSKPEYYAITSAYLNTSTRGSCNANARRTTIQADPPAGTTGYNGRSIYTFQEYGCCSDVNATQKCFGRYLWINTKVELGHLAWWQRNVQAFFKATYPNAAIRSVSYTNDGVKAL